MPSLARQIQKTTYAHHPTDSRFLKRGWSVRTITLMGGLWRWHIIGKSIQEDEGHDWNPRSDTGSFRKGKFKKLKKKISINSLIGRCLTCFFFGCPEFTFNYFINLASRIEGRQKGFFLPWRFFMLFDSYKTFEFPIAFCHTDNGL